jgi:hypothetical protein
MNTQQLHGYDELRYNQAIIQKLSVKIDTEVVSLFVSAS